MDSFRDGELISNRLEKEGGVEAEHERFDQVFRKLPKVEAMSDVWQNKFHEFDVLQHTEVFVAIIRQLTDDENLVAAGWLHDVGKPEVAKPKMDDQGKEMQDALGHPYHEFEDHESVGRQMVLEMDSSFFTSLGLDQSRVADLVGCHYLPMKGIKAMRKAGNWDDFRKAFFVLRSRLEGESVGRNDIMTMFFADKIAQGKFCTDKDELFLIRQLILADAVSDDDLRGLYEMQKAE